MENATRYIAYIRVSTAQQGESRLGIEVQQAAIAAKVGAGNIVAEFVEVESGKNNARPQLAAAAAQARAEGCTIVVSKLDRLGRNAAFLFFLAESGLKILTADLGELDTLKLGMFATLAQYEAEIISKRTKDALAAKKERGAKLGNPNPRTGRDATAAARAANKARSTNNENTRRAAAYLEKAADGKSIRTLAAELNAAGFQTATGKPFGPSAVKRILDTINP